MRKVKPDSFVRGVALRDIAALKRRVQALEKAMWPSASPSGRIKTAKRRVIEVDEATARRLTIEAFYKSEHEDWVRKNPRLLEGRRADRARLNKYLHERGFAPEPEIDE